MVDATGIDGRYVNFTPPSAIQNVAGPTAGGNAAPEANGTISISEALDKQLGLKPRVVKGSVRPR